MKKFTLLVVLGLGFCSNGFAGDIAMKDREIKMKNYDAAAAAWAPKKEKMLALEAQIDKAKASLNYWKEQLKVLKGEKAAAKAESGFEALQKAYEEMKKTDTAATRVAFARASSKFGGPTKALRDSLMASSAKRIELEKDLLMELRRPDLPSLETVIQEKIDEAKEVYDDLFKEKKGAELDPDFIEAKTRFEAAAMEWYNVSQTESLDVTARQLVALNGKIDALIAEITATRVATEKQAVLLSQILNNVDAALKNGTKTEQELQSVLIKAQNVINSVPSGGYQCYYDPVRKCFFYQKK